MKADAVVCGGGLMGLSIAYHLAKRGASVMLFERDCPQFSIGSHSETRVNTGVLTAPMFYSHSTAQTLAKTSFELYSRLAAKGNFLPVGFNQCGRVYLARTPPNQIQLRRMLSRLRSTSPGAELIDSKVEMCTRWPMLNLDDVTLAIFSPDDIVMDANALETELARGARESGANIYEGRKVNRVLLGDDNRVYAVDTDEGLIETRNFVNAAGMWSSMMPVKEHPEGYVKIASHPCCYMFLSTDRLPQASVKEATPVFVDLDGGVHICPTEFRTICGGFARSDHRALSLPTHNPSNDWHIPSPDWDRFYPVLKRLIHRCPSLSQLPPGDLITGAEMYTPNSYPLIGEYQAKGYYLANGLNGHGLTWAGGLGSLVADWVAEGNAPPIDVAMFDANRFLPLHSSPQYLVERVPEVAGNVFASLYHSHQCQTARNLRTSPIYGKLRDAGAMFGENMGYERPLWYADPPHPASSSDGDDTESEA